MNSLRQSTVITAIKTPYNEAGEIDYNGFTSLLQRQIDAGISAVVVCGTTGEGHLLTENETDELFRLACDVGRRQISIIANASSNSTKKACALSAKAFAAGATATLHTNPYYGRTSIAGMRQHFESVLGVGPGILYNVPSRTGQDIPPALIQDLAKLPNFVGIKECVSLERMAQHHAAGVTYWSGNDELAYTARAEHGAAGVISIASNVAPELMLRLMKGEAELAAKLAPLFEWLMCEPNPIPVSSALAILGACQPVFRLPYVPLTREQQAAGLGIIAQIGRASFVGESLAAFTRATIH